MIFLPKLERLTILFNPKTIPQSYYPYFIIPCLSSGNKPACCEEICKTFTFPLEVGGVPPPGTFDDPLPRPLPRPRPELMPPAALFAFIPLPPPPRPPPLPLEGGGIIARSGTRLSSSQKCEGFNLKKLYLVQLNNNAYVVC